MVDLDEFRRAMGEFGVSGPTRQALVWLAERLNEGTAQERERVDKRIDAVGRVARGIYYK